MNQRLRFVWAVAAFGAAGLGSATLLLLPWVKPDEIGIGAIVTLAMGLWTARGLARRSIPRSRLLLAAALLAVVPIAAVARAFGRIDLLAVIFHSEFGIEGTGPEVLVDPLIVAGPAAVVFYFSVRFLLALTGGAALFVPVLSLGIVLSNPLSFALVRDWIWPTPHEPLAGAMAEPLLRTQTILPDVVVVYLEGMEADLVWRAGPDAPGAALQEFAAEATQLVSIGQAEGTGWSLAGMVASQCGVPLVRNGFRAVNKFTSQKDFMAARTCLGDVTASHGYSTAFFVGGDADFAGIGHFVRTHRMGEPIDKSALRDRYPPEEFRAADAGWVVDDQMVFDAGLEWFRAKSADPGPLMLTIETTGPHGDRPYASRRCQPDGQARQIGNLDLSARCTAEDAAAFLAALRGFTRDRPLALIVLSDHLNHSVEMRRRISLDARYNTVLLYREDMPPAVIDRPGAMFDVYPTILSFLGFADLTVRAGLGRSLLGSDSSLMETMGRDLLNASIIRDPDLPSAIWN